MNTFRFHYDIKLAQQLRDAVNEKQNLSIEKEHKHEKGKYVYHAWDRICAIMDRLENTINYVNSLELGRCEYNRLAFDFYEFINCSYVIIDCIKTMGYIFEIDSKSIANIEESKEIFGNKYSLDGCDGNFFEYVRSLCVVHPLYTNRQKAYLSQSKFHCCPFVYWGSDYNIPPFKDYDLVAIIYTSKDGTIRLPLYVKEFEKYLGKWINLIPKVIEAKEKYANNIYENFRNEPVKFLSDFKKDIVEYLYYLKGEYGRRFGNEQCCIFDEFIRVFNLKLTDNRNDEKLNKYKNAIIYSLTFLRNAMQNMSFKGYENTGIKHPTPNIETDLFNELSYISSYESSLSEYSYNLSKIYYLESDSPYDYYDKIYARQLLKEPIELINEYVVFTNTEPDEEVIVLIHLVLYLDSLKNDTLLNKNIPNEKEFREQLLNKDELEGLFATKPNDNTLSSNISLEEILMKYGI